MKNKKIVVAGLIAASLAVLPMAAFAASYTTGYTFKYQLYGKDNGMTYAMSAGSITVDQTSTTGYLSGQNQTYSQSLMKLGFFSDTTIGTVAVDINGYETNTWTNQNAGTYYLYLLKTNDGQYTSATGTISN